MSKLRSLVSVPLKRYVWNFKYGLLGYPQFVAPEDVLNYLSANLTDTSSLLDLGCGRGTLLEALRKQGFKGPYCGVEISPNALKQARRYLDHRSTWVASDIENFDSPFRWDAIIFVESVYYVDLRRLPGVLSRVTKMLEVSGFLLIRLHDTIKHKQYVDLISDLYPSLKRVGDNLFSIESVR